MNLGTLLRRSRKARRLTLKVVADKAGISEGFLSQVENNVKSPSVDTLMNICDAIGENVGDLLNQLRSKERLFVMPKNEWSEVDVPASGFATRRFCAPEDRTIIDTAILFINPGKSIPVRKNLKNGQELLCVMAGSLELNHSDRSVTLEEGDAVHFWSEPTKQSITNTGDQQAVVLWVGTI